MTFAFSSKLCAQTYDSDAQSFITAAGISSPDQKIAINRLVICLKDSGLWSKMKAVYPFVGDSAYTQKWNLKDPRDLDAAYRLTFSGTITHNSKGAKWDGSTGYANTHCVLANQNAMSMTYYSKDSSTSSDWPMGVYINSQGTQAGMYFYYDNPTWTLQARTNTYDGSGYTTVSSITDSRGLWTSTRTGSTANVVYQNGIKKDSSASPSNTLDTGYPVFLGARNLSGATGFSSRQCSFASIGDSGLSTKEAFSLHVIVDSFLYRLEHGTTTENNNSSSYDADAQAFFTAYSITNATQKNAINNFVLAAKSHGYWNSLTEIYPFVGGTSSTHAGNLKAPGTHSLTFSGGDHSGTGWDGNGAYDADTHIDYSTINNSAFTAAVYSRENADELGALFGAGNDMELLPSYNGNLYSDIPTSSTRKTIDSSFNSAGLFTVTLTANSLHTVYKNATNIGSQTNGGYNPPGSYNIKLNSWGGGRYGTRQISFAAFSTTTGLTETQVNLLYNDVNTLQCALSRSVDSCTAGSQPGGTPGGCDSNWVRAGNNIYYNNGNVGIGTSNPLEKLSVNGTVAAKKIKVTIDSANWPDYVFHEKYKIPTVEQIEEYIKANQHLPGVPSAIEVAQTGVELAGLTTILVKKIEELTMLIIQLNNRIKILENNSKK